jgi:hypothetical protein
LPQTGWIESKTHSIVYQAYTSQLERHSWRAWEKRLSASQKILRNYGGKTFPLYQTLDTLDSYKKATAYLWISSVMFFLYTLVLPLSLTYGTTGTWSSMTQGQKLGFSYLWSILCATMPPWIFLGWHLDLDNFGIDDPTQATLWLLTMGLLNHIVLPLLVVWYNWQPFLRCKDTLVHTEDTCELGKECTNYSFLLPFAALSVEIVIWVVMMVFQ